MTFFDYNKLDQIHIELTNACNAACPMCARFYMNSPLMRPELEIEQISIEQFKEWFPPNILRKFKIILFCGTHGDPGMAKDLYEICQYIADVHPESCIRMHTNGGMRKPEFWSKLGKLFGESRKDSWSWQMIFSVDGLRDTNHLYRRNVDWDTLYENMKAYTAAGGRGDWDYLIFKHNEHQIAQAKDLAQQLGLNFIPKKSLGVDDGNNFIRMAAMNREGTLDYWIDAPTDPKNRNMEKEPDQIYQKVYPFDPADYKKLKESKTNVEFYQTRVKNCYSVVDKENTEERNNCKISCKAETLTKGIEVFVDNRGYVMPCCYIGTHLNGTHGDFKYLQLHHELNNYGWEKFSLKKHTLEEILLQRHLDKVFAETWNKSSIKEGKLAYCADTCGMYSNVDKIYTHDDMEDKVRLWRSVYKEKNNDRI